MRFNEEVQKILMEGPINDLIKFVIDSMEISYDQADAKIAAVDDYLGKSKKVLIDVIKTLALGDGDWNDLVSNLKMNKKTAKEVADIFNKS